MIGLTYEQIVSKIVAESGLSKEEVEERIKQKLKQLSDMISMEGAAHIVANELGIKVFESKKRLKINELQPLQRNVEVLGKVVKHYGIRSFKTEKKEGRNASFLIGDGTGVVRATVWDEKLLPEVEKMHEGDMVLLRGAYIRESQGFKEVHLGNGSSITINPLGEEVELQPSKKSIAELKERDFVTITGVVVEVFQPRFYEACALCNKKLSIDGKCSQHGVVEKRWLPVVNIILDDGTDNIRVVCFRELAEAILGVTREELLSMKDDLMLFESIKKKVLLRRVNITGKVTKNEMFDRLEFTAQSIEDTDPKKLIATETVL